MKARKKESRQVQSAAPEQAQDTPKKQKGQARARKNARLLSAVLTARKGSDVSSLMKKRSRQLRHVAQILQAAIRILNALDHKTIYRR